MRRNLKIAKYKTFRETINIEEDSTHIGIEDGFYQYPACYIQYYPDSCRITISLSPLERNLLEFMIKTMDNNFILKPDINWKNSFKKYLKVMGGINSPIDTSLRRGISNIKEKKGLILLHGENRRYMVNPLYFSRSDLNRDLAIKFLLNIGLLRTFNKRTNKKMGLNFDAAQMPKKIKTFSLSSFHYRQRRQELNEILFEKELNMIVETEPQDKTPVSFQN